MLLQQRMLHSLEIVLEEEQKVKCNSTKLPQIQIVFKISKCYNFIHTDIDIYIRI